MKKNEWQRRQQKKKKKEQMRKEGKKAKYIHTCIYAETVYIYFDTYVHTRVRPRTRTCENTERLIRMKHKRKQNARTKHVIT